MQAILNVVSGFRFAYQFLENAEQFFRKGQEAIKGLETFGIKFQQGCYVANRMECQDMARKIVLLEGSLKLIEQKGPVPETLRGYVAQMDNEIGKAQAHILDQIMPANYNAIMKAAWIGKKLLSFQDLRSKFAKITSSIYEAQQALTLGLQAQVFHQLPDLKAQLFQERKGQAHTDLMINQADLLEYLQKEKIQLNTDMKKWLYEVEKLCLEEVKKVNEQLMGIKSGVTDIKGGISDLKYGVEDIKGGVEGIKGEVRSQKDTLASILALLTKKRRSLKLPEIKKEDIIYDSKESLGVGSGGDVHLGQLKTKTGRMVPVAFKLYKIVAGQDPEPRARNEARIAWLLKHQNCVGIYGICLEPLGILFEYCTGNCLTYWLYSMPNQESGLTTTYTYRKNAAIGKRSLTLPERIHCTNQILEAIRFMHSKKLIHRDLKSMNIFVQNISEAFARDFSEDPTLRDKRLLQYKIGDFGSASPSDSFCYTSRLSNDVACATTGGTFGWLPLEALDDSESRGPITQSVDIYSFGVVLGEIFLSEPPYAGKNQSQSAFLLSTGTLPYSNKKAELKALSPRLAQLIDGCLKPPENRVTLDEVSYSLWPAARDELEKPKPGGVKCSTCGFYNTPNTSSKECVLCGVETSGISTSDDLPIYIFDLPTLTPPIQRQPIELKETKEKETKEKGIVRPEPAHPHPESAYPKSEEIHSDTKGIPPKPFASLDTRRPSQFLSQLPPNILFEEGQKYESGTPDHPINIDNALKNYRLAANQRYAPALIRLAQIYYNGFPLHSIPPSLPYGLKLYHQAADEKKSAVAQWELSQIYAKGRDSAEEKKCRDYCKLAADQGHLDAIRTLATYLRLGEKGFTKNETEAKRYYQAGKDKFNDAECQFQLGCFYHRGRGGVPKPDQEKALSLFTQAVTRDEKDQHIEALRYLGLFHAQGLGGLTPNPKKAFEYFNKAALKGEKNAQYSLGEFYEKEKNYAEAEKWYRAASHNGQQFAEEGRARVRALLEEERRNRK